MIYGYIRVSTDKQSTENQRFEIKRFTKEKNIKVDQWVEETISGTKSVNERELGKLIKKVRRGDILIISELSRLGRNLMQIMSFLHQCMEKNICVLTVKERYELGNNINSKILAFAFSLSAEIERNLISQCTKEALARKKKEGMVLGRPKGCKSSHYKLSGKEKQIQDLLNKNHSKKYISKILGVNRQTLRNFLNKNREEL